MSWRTVVISSRCKLDLKMGYMVVRGEEVSRIYLDEIAILLIENPAVAMTGCLLSELVERKIKVIFCDNKRTPQAELVPYYGCHDTSRKIRMQIAWTEPVMGAVWGAVVAEKIRNQSIFLRELSHIKEAELLESYLGQIEFQDATNREGHAAKVYFNALFGMEFTRPAENPINAALDYGYAILLSAFNREVASNGYLTQLGLHHGNVFNRFNLSSDLMEPFRILVDRVVCREIPKEFGKETKRMLFNVMNDRVQIGESEQTVLNAISIYTKSVLEALNSGDLTAIKFWRYEL